MSSTNTMFPIVDIKYMTETYLPWKASYLQDFHNDPKILQLADEIFNAFQTSGFLYLKNHGFSDELIENGYKLSKEFFQMPPEIKNIYKRRKELRNRGYLGFDTEVFDATRPFDVKEAFDYVPVTSYSKITPNTDDHVLGFDKMNSQFFKKGIDLTGLLIQLFAISLNLEDKEFFKMQCQSAGDISKNPTNFRSLWYPEIKHEVVENQLRCSVHSDFGIVSLLFQDGTGGLQVLNPEGEYIDMTPCPGTVAVNIADMLEVWSSGKLKSTKHRVVLPSNGSVRQSLAFFLHPDYKANIFCLDGSNKHEAFEYKDNYLKVEEDHYGY